MAYQFQYVGGVSKPTMHTSEKFLLFFVLDGREIPFYQLKENGLITQLFWKNPDYTVANNVAKLFVGQKGFGIPSLWYSFYIRLVDGAGPMVTIRPFSGTKSGFFFKARCHFMRQKEILQLLDGKAVSREFVLKQKLMPVEMLKRMVTVDKSFMKEGVRAIKIGAKG
uniref:Uncharacterized protein n=1 Tax=viral metagenome TaxID=1070528 RepID=A0A6M3M976_9ZZZZ